MEPRKGRALNEDGFQRWWPLGATAALLGLALLLVRLRHDHVPLGLPLDDAWIHCAFASHLARFGEWGLFAHRPSGGESSPLWPVLLSLGELGGWHAAPRLALVLGAMFFIPLPALLAALATGRPAARWVAVVAALWGPLLFLALSGMETIAALTVSMTALYWFSRGRTMAAGLWAGAAAFLRPDALLLLGVLTLMRRDRSLVPGWVVAGAALSILALLEGRFPPATLGGRRWLMGLPPQLEWGFLGHGGFDLVTQWVRAVGADLGGGRVLSAHPSRGLEAVRWLWKISVLVVLVPGCLRLLRGGHRRSQGRRALLLWTATALAFYALVLPSRGHVGRYQAMVHLVLALTAVEGLFGLWNAPGRLRWVAVVPTVLLGLGWVGGLVEISGLWTDAVAHLDRVHLRAAAELERLPEGESRVAIFDVGAAAYLHDGEMLDLSGLSDPSLACRLPRASEGAVARWLRARKATHLLLPIWRDGAADGLDRRLGLELGHGMRLTELRRWKSPPGEWARAFQFSGNAFPQLVLYRLEWIR